MVRSGVLVMKVYARRGSNERRLNFKEINTVTMGLTGYFHNSNLPCGLKQTVHYQMCLYRQLNSSG